MLFRSIRRSTRKDRKRVFATFDELIQFFGAPGYNDPLQETDAEFALADPAIVDQPEPVSHAVYGSLRHHKRGWILALDIDAKDIAQQEARESVPGCDSLNRKQLLKKSGFKDTPPANYPYTYSHIRTALQEAFEIKKELETTFEFEETMVVYTGQGAHVYGVDNDPKHQYDSQSREVLNFYFEKMQGYPIDTVVTADEKRVMRLPYSLHTDVSRIVTPVESPEFDFKTRPLPNYL